MLHEVIREYLDAFLRAADRADGAGLPKFIAREFREFLTCGVLAHGFARVRCADCAFERLLPFSCGRRGFCPSCGGRRMTERAAHLVDEVVPLVPVRQWVLTLPYRLRYLLAWDHGLSRALRTPPSFSGSSPISGSLARGPARSLRVLRLRQQSNSRHSPT